MNDQLCINTIRCLAIDMVEQARSGHPGMPMGMAPAAYTLWTRYLRHNPRNPKWPNRDRFVLSAGHGSALLYALLHLTGYDLPLEELKRFRQWNSATPGHPEFGHTPGVEATTGPLGQGVANAVGMAIAEKYSAATFNREGFSLIDYNIYVIAGDGCLQEGVSGEACSLAGHLGLDNLIVIYDDNQVTIDGNTSLSFTENVTQRYESYGWFVQTVEGDGNQTDIFERALQKALKEPQRPSLIRMKTLIGYGSPGKQGSSKVHGSPLGAEETRATKLNLGWSEVDTPFFVPEMAAKEFRKSVAQGEQWESEWNYVLEQYTQKHPALAESFRQALQGYLPINLRDHLPTFEAGTKIATRAASGKVLDALMPSLPMVLGGSADLTPSNNTQFAGVEDFQIQNRTGRYVRYGVREHAMGAIMNGISISGLLRAYGGTFLAFSDYMRPTLRLAALSKYPSIFVFTHDSVGLGEDGPTHQPVEHLPSLRAIPGLTVFRPADAKETAFAWKTILENPDGPYALILSRQGLPVLDGDAPKDTNRGGYILVGDPEPNVLLIASGSEVSLAVAAHEKLKLQGFSSQVVSMPSWERFEQQSELYQRKVLPPSVKARVGIEAAVPMGWERFLGDCGVFVGMSGFGASAPGGVCFEKFGITVDRIVEAAAVSLQTVS